MRLRHRRVGTWIRLLLVVAGLGWAYPVPAQTVIVSQSALPTGAATAANQTTMIGHLDGVEGLLGTLDGRVDGLETLIGTTNTTLTAISGFVDGLETLLGGTINVACTSGCSASGGTSQADNSAVTNITGVGALYDTTPPSITDGNVGLFRMDASRYLYTVFPSAQSVDTELGSAVLAADNLSLPTAPWFLAATMCYDGAFMDLCRSASAVYDAAAPTDGPLGFLRFDEVSVDTVDEGDGVSWRGSNTGEAYVVLRDAAGNARGANVNASNQLQVTGPVTNAGTFAVQESGAALTALQLLDDVVIAHDAVDAAATLGLGHRAIAHGSNPTAVAAGDRTVGYANRAGVPFMIAGHPNVITREAHWTDADGAQTNTALIDISAGTKVVVTAALATCDAGNSGAVAVRVGFGASLPAAATTGTNGIVLSHAGISPGSGAGDGEGSGIIGIGGDGEDLRYTAEDPAGGACDLVVKYYTVDS